MEIIGSLLGAGASVASGGLFGLLGSLVGVGTKYLQQRQANAQRSKEWLHEIELRKLNMEAGDRETENELAIAQSEGSWRGLEASYKTVIPASQVHTVVNDLRALFRPLLTFSLIALSAVLFWWVWSGILEANPKVLAVFSESDIKDIIRYMIHTIFFSTSTAIVWWFGDRAMAPPGSKTR